MNSKTDSDEKLERTEAPLQRWTGPGVREDVWSPLRRFTSARIALGRAGGSMPTRHQLAFQLAHASARDAVWSHFDPDALAAELGKLGHPVLTVESAARDRAEYLQRPDLGRRLAPESRASLVQHLGEGVGVDLAIIVTDGLSALAVTTQSPPFLAELFTLLSHDSWSIAPVIVARHGRVALEDEIGEICRAKISLILIGERPGLGSPDSMGIYFIYSPKPEKTDADRNCVSNIRQGGLPPVEAARKVSHLLSVCRNTTTSGVLLKDDGGGGDVLADGRIGVSASNVKTEIESEPSA
jgi:ethanolamine ammonia-lyase small subunit